VYQAADAGIPKDQLSDFLRGGYIAQPWQLTAHAVCRDADQEAGPFWIAVGGSRGPGKSHLLMAQVGLDDCQRYPGLKFLFLRKIQKAAGESVEDLVKRVFRYTPHSFSTSNGRIDFPNGSRIIIGGYKDEADIDKYIGIEFDGMVIEEFTQISEGKVTKIRGSVRSSRTDGWRPRIYISTNPGGIGHAYFKKEFVEPNRAEIEDHRLLGGVVRFIPATYRDNRYLDKAYVEYLLAIPGLLGKAWREGDFDAFEGMAFPEWNESRHVVEPFEIPSHWPRWRAVDWGWSAPFCCGWFAKDTDTGRVIMYRELYENQLTDRQQARKIIEYTPPSEDVRFTYADPSMWSKKNMLGIVSSSADEYLEEGVLLTKADNDRLSGIRKVHRALADLPDGQPGLQIFSTCHNIIRTLPSLPSDPLNPEDVDTEAEDHAFDMLKYALTNQRVLSSRRTKRRNSENPFTQIQSWK
jgi:phage terminase large subunit